MGLLDSKFSLPAISSSVSSVSNTVSSSVSFAVTSATTKVAEAVRSTINTFGGTSSFTKIGANTPTFDQIKAAAMTQGSTLVGGTGELVNQQIADLQASVDGSASASAVKAAAGVVDVNNDHLVTLSEANRKTIEFKVMPVIVEARTVEYEAVAPAQFPGSFQKYKGTSAVQWTLNVTLISRNTEEARQNYEDLNFLRGWTQPFFGDNTAQIYRGQLGAPPPVLMLKGLRNLVGPVPVVITSLNWNWPKDVDYLPISDEGGNSIPFPAVMEVAIQLVESFSTSQFNRFSLLDYRNGDMVGAYNSTITS